MNDIEYIITDQFIKIDAIISSDFKFKKDLHWFNK